MSLVVQNILLFQIGWFVCVIGGASEYTAAAVPTVLAIVIIHLIRAVNATRELYLIVLATLIGTIWDSALTLAGLLNFSTGVVINGVAPYWLIAMWALFATTLNVSMKWLRGKWLLCALFGAAGGVAAYYAGYKLNAVDFNNIALSLSVIAIGWALIMPLLVFIAMRFNGYDNGNNNYQNTQRVST